MTGEFPPSVPLQGPSPGPLRGLRVLELGHYVSVPFCTRMLADLGAEVIKVEAPSGGDPMRTSGKLVDGRALWWSSLARNKKLVTLDLRQPSGQEIARELMAHCDVVIENFRAGQLERWNLGWDVVQAVNPRASLVRVSGFGQTGPYSSRVAFAAIAEATGGLTYVTGSGDGAPPTRPSLSLGDSITGLNAFGILLAALYERDAGGTNRGRCIDIAMYESVFAVMDAAITEYGALGQIRAPAASTAVFSPSGNFHTRDDRWIMVTASGNAVFQRLVGAIGLPQLADDPRFRDNADRVRHAGELAIVLQQWIGGHDAVDVERTFEAASVPASRIYSVADCAQDEQFAARGSVVSVDDPHFGAVLHPPIPGRFTDDGSQPSVRWPGGNLGQHNEEVYGGLLGLDADARERLRATGTI